MSPSPRIGRTERALALEHRRKFTRNPNGNPSSLEAARKALAEKRAEATRRAQSAVQVNRDPVARSTTPALKPQIQGRAGAAPTSPIPEPMAAPVPDPVAAGKLEVSWQEERDRARQQIERPTVESIRPTYAKLPSAGLGVAESGTPEPVAFVARRRPRATRPTAAITAAAVRYLKAGCPLDVVAKIVLGARYDELYRWLLVGSGQEPTMIRVPKPYCEFHDRVVRAMAEAEARNVVTLQESGSPKWALAWLRARAPQQWSSKDTAAVEALVPHTTKDGRVLMVPPELAAFLARMRSEKYVDPRDRDAAPDQEPEPSEPVAAEALEGGDAAHPKLPRVVKPAPANQSVAREALVPGAPVPAPVPELKLEPCTCATEHTAAPRTATWWTSPVPPATKITVDVKLVDGKWQDDTGRVIPEHLLNPLPPCVGCVWNKQGCEQAALIRSTTQTGSAR